METLKDNVPENISGLVGGKIKKRKKSNFSWQFPIFSQRFPNIFVAIVGKAQ